jgi:hypothetical protein
VSDLEWYLAWELMMKGLNNYEWCGDSSYNSSGWADIVRGFSEIPTASYMSEYG